jgi:PAS domain S-box-containing protein
MSKLRELGGDIGHALERVKVPSYVIDEYGIIRWVNSAGRQLVGDVRGKQFTSVVAREETARARNVFARHLMTTEDVDLPIVLMDTDGDRVSVEISSVCLYSGERVIGIFGQLTDLEVAQEHHPHPHLTPRQSEVLRLLSRHLAGAGRPFAPRSRCGGSARAPRRLNPEPSRRPVWGQILRCNIGVTISCQSCADFETFGEMCQCKI